MTQKKSQSRATVHTPATRVPTRKVGKITVRIDPLADDESSSAALDKCLNQRERRLVELRRSQCSQRIIANRLRMSMGWTCEKLAEIRTRCGWENAKPKKMKPRQKREAIQVVTDREARIIARIAAEQLVRGQHRMPRTSR